MLSWLTDSEREEHKLKSIQVTFFWDVTPCTLVNGYYPFEE